MMVSRQETQRALLTPGEIMQLPVTDEIVMVSGAPPVRARKLRYFEDGNFTVRVMPAAEVVRPSVAGSHDWLGTIVCTPLATSSTRNDDREGEGGLGLKPELGEFPARFTDDLAAEIAPDEEEDIAPEQDGHLQTVRRAVAMDQGDKDFLPDF
jgi:type IV secretion system protein VirD4